MSSMELFDNMALDFLVQAIRQSCQGFFADLVSKNQIPSVGLRRSARLPIIGAIQDELNRPILFVTDRTDRALTIADEIALWLPNNQCLTYPEPTPLFYEDASWGENSRRNRLIALTTLASYHIPGVHLPDNAPIIIAPIRALMTRTMPRQVFLKATRKIRRGQEIQLAKLLQHCLSIGYEPSSIVVAAGQYASRGGILDIWPPFESLPVRIELFGDIIETMRRFEPGTQRSLHQKRDSNEESILITPAREVTLAHDSPLRENGYPASEFMIPVIYPNSASLLDYLSRHAIVVIDDCQAIEETSQEIEEQAIGLRNDAIKEGILPDDFPIPYISWSEIQDGLSLHKTIDLGVSIDQDKEVGLSDIQKHSISKELNSRFSPGPRFGGHLKSVMEYLIDINHKGGKIVVVSRQSARLNDLWNDTLTQKVNNSPTFIEATLTEGWIFEACDGSTIHLLTDGEIFGWRRPEPRRRGRPIADSPESNYNDLKSNDWVVHIDHGIGRYDGLVRRTVDGIEREYLCIEYAAEAQLFVPVHQADRISRYVGPDSRTPTLSRLGSSEWRNVKTHVKEAVQQVAEDILELYARRSIVKGFSYQEDTQWQSDLEASFPYIETEDQIRVLSEVKKDMQANRPMDRLICGDVGYGKTEVALRAAFKAVMDNKQVAILVPTTVLAQQHFYTFQQRLVAFPIELEMLSRFRTPQQQRDIVNRLSLGKIDIVIGTHRLLSSDVEFKDMGLLIIDEEQRFGVTHKESLKKLRTEVDVLTMTATPIPRTLYMALSGVRDISTINTPPEERLPVVTHVGPYSPRLVRQAILREMERGGQVFFVHNRVHTISAMLRHLNNIIPEAKIAIAHGQMPENELSQRMEEFTAGDVDLLLSTSIIESGLDIPNANTLIVDRADTFGLAQLYQLRGRVGRGAQRAYAYFFRHNRKLPTPEGRQRLETIAENTQLGSGFSIAMRDLEIRGTGDILGTRQHGHIAAIGFHLYTSLLAEAVQTLRKKFDVPTKLLPRRQTFQLTPVNVDLPLAVGIPTDYVPETSTRLGLYRRIADLHTFIELDTIREEFIDRFGPIPPELQNLFFQLKIKLLADRAGLTNITMENGQFALRFPDNVFPEWMPDLGPTARLGKTAIWIPFKGNPDWANTLESVLEVLQNLTNEPSFQIVDNK